jgi:hypothetical protein
MEQTGWNVSGESAAAEAEVRAALKSLRDALDRFEMALGGPASAPAAQPPASPAFGSPASAWAPANDYSWPSQPPAVQSPAQATPDPTTKPKPATPAAWSDDAPMEPAAWPYPRPSATPALPTSAQALDLSAEEVNAREQVRRAIAELRRDIEAGSDDAAQPSEAASDDAGDDARESVRATVEHIAGVTPLADVPADGPFDVREQVRRAVEEAKAEINASGVGELQAKAIADAFDPEKLRIPHYEALLDERFLQPAIIVIDDPEGRVELVRVYRTLARLDVAVTANLANYSSHSVTVQLEERKLPAEQEIASAIGYAFERECTIDIDGNRASVRLFGNKTKVA